MNVSEQLYRRYGISLTDIPDTATPHTHSDELELFCAKQCLAAYTTYNIKNPYYDHDHIPSKYNQFIYNGSLNINGMLGRAEEDVVPPLDAESGYRVLESDRAGALIIWNNKSIVIAFRGTASWQDWMHNLNCSLVKSQNNYANNSIQLHKGFLGLSENISPSVFDFIEQFLKMRKSDKFTRPINLYVCGHSLGGALALNFAAQIGRYASYDYRFGRNSVNIGGSYVKIASTYTFGSPRIGRGEIWEYVRRPHYRLIVSGDPVPKFPLNLDDDFEAAYLANPFDDVACPTGAGFSILKAMKAKYVPTFSLTAHDIENYIEAIQKKIARKMK